MAQIDLDSKKIGEWIIDLAITAAAFFVGVKFFMTEGVALADQPIAGLIAFGCGALGFRVARHIKTLG